MSLLFLSTLISSCRFHASADSDRGRIVCLSDISTSVRYSYFPYKHMARMKQRLDVPLTSVEEPTSLPLVELAVAVCAAVHPFIDLPISKPSHTVMILQLHQYSTCNDT